MIVERFQDWADTFNYLHWADVTLLRFVCFPCQSPLDFTHARVGKWRKISKNTYELIK